MNPKEPFTLLIVSDNHIVRSGLRRILESHPQFVIAADMTLRDAGNIGPAGSQLPDIVLIDFVSNSGDALALVGKLKKERKDTLVVVMDDLGDAGRIRKALELGAAGVFLKFQPPSVLIATIESLVSLLSPQVELRKVEPPMRATSRIQRRGHSSLVSGKMENLTERERDIVALISSGLKNKDIAEQLHISDITVRHHLTNIFMKLGVSNRQKLLIMAHQYGLTKLALNPEVS